MFRTAELLATSGGYRDMNSVNAFDVNDRRPDPWPKWLEQVLRRVERVSAHDDSVRGVQEDGYFESLPANLLC